MSRARSARPNPICPLCGSHPVCESVTRMDLNTYICRDCAVTEAASVYGCGARTCLWFDDRLGIVALTEGEPAYLPLFAAKADADWARHYVNETNDRLGRGPATVAAIALSCLAA